MRLRTTSVLLCLASLAGCSGKLCGNSIVHAFDAPSGKMKAVVFGRDCGTSTNFSTQISIVTTADTLANESGNALVLDGAVPLGLKWTSAESLEITGIGTAKVLKQEHSVGGVQLSYSR